MIIRDYYPCHSHTITDILKPLFDEMDFFSPQSNSYTFRGQIVDTTKFDIIPKREFIEREITRKEEELRRSEEMHKITLKQKQDEIDSLRKKLINK